MLHPRLAAAVGNAAYAKLTAAARQPSSLGADGAAVLAQAEAELTSNASAKPCFTRITEWLA